MATRTTILDAVMEALKHRPNIEGVSAKEILERIAAQRLYDFKAKDPLGVVRGTIRKHLRTAGDRPRLRLVGRDRYRLP